MKSKKYQVNYFNIQVQYHDNPAEVFYQLCGKKTSTLLLESSEINKKRHIKSMMIIDSALRITAYGSTVNIQALTKNGINLLPLLKQTLPNTIKINNTTEGLELVFPVIPAIIDEDTRLKSISIFDCIRTLLRIIKPSDKNIPKTTVFLGGLFSYDLISCFENLPKLINHSACPDYCFYLAETLLIFDHPQCIANLQSTLFYPDSSEQHRLHARMHQLKKQLQQKPISIPYKKIHNMVLICNQNDEEYKKNICKIQLAIRQGEILQAVPSRCFSLPCPSPLAAYHTLKNNNPSPYMFFMQDTIFTLFGASPESSLKYNADTRQIEIYPIAGTRARVYYDNGSLNKDADNRIELEMRLNHKELAEHLMLVDLARNDLARVCQPGSRYVADLLKVDRYSYVMHLVSRVIGKLRYDLDVLHAYRACMNMGTLTGAPKVRAMQIIYEIEKTHRNTYGGAIGYLTGSGCLDTCIIIRAAYVTKQIAKIQAGAGIVIDSVPQLEADESRNKARAVLQAIAEAHHASKDLF